MSLINIEVSNKIREVSNKQQIIFNYVVKKETSVFDDNNIDAQIKNRINHWVEDIVDSISIEYSSIQTQKLKALMQTDKSLLSNYTQKVFRFFLKELNIEISPSKAQNISEFILSEIENKIANLELENI